LGLSGLISW